MDVTVADLQQNLPDAILIQLTNDDPAAITINVAIANQAIADAFAEMWPYIGVKFSVPIVPTPPALKPSIVSTAIKNLYARKVEELPPMRRDDYRVAIRFWKDVAAGIVTLGIDPPPAAPIVGSPESNTPDNTGRVFTKDSLKGF
jgi:phage gp36-like protein